MARDILRNIKIRGISCAVPDHSVKTTEYSTRFGEGVIEKFVESVGIESRYVSPQPQITTSDLCYVAANDLLDRLQIDRSSIDGVILVTQHPDYPSCPASACVLQYRLGLDQECFAYDVNQGCAGYIYGLYIAGSHMQNGNLKRILLLAGDAGHRVSPNDKSMAMLFGDAGSATLLEYDEQAAPIPMILQTIGSGFRSIICPAGGSRHREANSLRVEKGDGIIRSDYDGQMEGIDVFNFTIKQVPKLLKEYFAITNTDANDYDLYALHQANKLMLSYIAKKGKLDMKKIPISLVEYGNTSSASIPLTLCDYVEKNPSVGEKHILASGFGVGLSLGVAGFHIDMEKCFPIIKTLERFEDGVL